MADRSITSANAVFTLAIPGLFPVPQQIQGFQADSMFDTDEVEIAQTVMGADGHQSSGAVTYSVSQKISLMPDSLSNDLFEAVMTAQNATKDVYRFQGYIRLPGLKKAVALINGVLTKGKLIDPAKKMLEGRDYTIMWESVIPAPAL